MLQALLFLMRLFESMTRKKGAFASRTVLNNDNVDKNRLVPLDKSNGK